MVNTSADYDSLLNIFCSKDELRPQLMQPNVIGDKTYATDAFSAIIIPNNLLKNKYGCHVKCHDFKPILNSIVYCSQEKYKDTDLFKALQVHPKEYDTIMCKKCDGEGTCAHCGATCEYCDGYGEVEDKKGPMIYGEKGTIQIEDQLFFPNQLGRLEKVLLELMVDEFYIIGRFNRGALIKVGGIELIICKTLHNVGMEEELKNYVLSQTK